MGNRFQEFIQENLPLIVHVWGPKVLMALVLLLVFWLASRFVRKAIFAAGDKADLEYPVVRLMAMAARVTLLVAGLVTPLGTLGVDVSALVAGLGLTGFALGFAIKVAYAPTQHQVSRLDDGVQPARRPTKPELAESVEAENDGSSDEDSLKAQYIGNAKSSSKSPT